MNDSVPTDPRIGTLLADRYRIDALIGEGGMGRVYSAEHVMMKKRLAVKILRRELTSVPEVVARFEREAMAAANIDHPNVAAATDFGKLSDGSVFLVLEFVQGKSLRDEIAAGPMAVTRALHIARQIAAGLGSAHAQSIVHRDLKPENVMLVERGTDPDFVKVLDFGIAKVPVAEVPSNAPKDQPITRAGMVFGTPEYMSPEQALGQTVDGRADLYSLGVILFEMLTGSRPFSSGSPVGILGQQLANPPPALAERTPGISVPPAVEQLVHRLLDRDRDKRFSLASELVHALDVLLTPPQHTGGYRFTLADGTPGSRPDTSSAPLAEAARSAQASDADTADDAATRRVEPIDDSPLQRGIRAVASVFPPADALRERLPERLRESLRPLPARTLLAATAVAALVIVALLVALGTVVVRSLSRPSSAPSAAVASSPSTLASAAKPGPRATTAELQTATSEGPLALETLAAKHPLDPEPLIAAAGAWLAAKDPARATGQAARALALDPNTNRDNRLAAVLFQTAQTHVAADPAFALLQGPMASAGAVVLWDLAALPTAPSWVRQRAGQWLRSPAFRKVAPRSLVIAADLRTATTCEAAHALLPEAKAAADERSLQQLFYWSQKVGCGRRKRQDCMPCLRKDSALEDAIAAIRARQAKPPDANAKP
ncbi:MAG: protein kinase domain-containing protein [Myxococcota bacterium]